MVKNNNESAGCHHQQHGTNSNGTNSNELQFSRHRLELELKFAMAKNDKAELQASNAKLEAKNDMLQRQFGKYQGIQRENNHLREINGRLIKKIEQISRELGKKEGAEEILVRRLTDTETQNSQFLLGDNEMDPKLLESVVVDGHGYYEKKEEEAEHEELNGSEDYMSVTSESQYTPMMNFVAGANPTQVEAHSETPKRKKPKKIESKSITKQKKVVAADRNKKPATILPSSSSNSNGQGVEGDGGKRPKCDLCPKTFANKYLLQRHYSSHGSDDKPFQCEHCHKCFARKDVYAKHIRWHAQQQGEH